MKTLNTINKIIVFIFCAFELWLKDFVSNAYDHWIVNDRFQLKIRDDAQFPCIILLSGTVTYVSIWSLRSAAGTDQSNGLGH